MIGRLVRGFAVGTALIVVSAGAAAAQTPPTSSRPGGLWIVAGGGSTTILGDCTDCEDRPYLHTTGWLGIVGTRLTPRSDVGVEVFWSEATSPVSDPIRTAFVMGTFQFRPWRSSGFFLRFSSGMAFEKNWIVTPDPNPPVFTSKAFALEIGAGWEWQLTRHVGAQAFGAQYVAALGDLTTRDATFENVMGNFWTAGAAIVIR
jgi:hypothetical protein